MTRAPEPDIDEELSTALATIEVPDHRAGFWNGLGERLMAERERPAASEYDPKERAEQVDRRADAVLETAPVRRPTLRLRRKPPKSPRHPAVAQLAEHAGWVREPPNRRPGMIGLVVFAIAVVIAGALWLGGAADQRAAAETSAEVAARMSRNLVGVGSLLGTVEVTRPGGVERFSFVRAANGSFRYQGASLFADSAYDATALTGRTWRATTAPDGSGQLISLEETGLAGGPPDPDGHFPFRGDDDIARMVRTLEISGTAKARPITFAGRKALRLEADQVPTMEDPADHLEVIVDRAALLPMEVQRTVAGRSVERRRFSDVRTTATVVPGAFLFTFPPNIPPSSTNDGFTSVPLSQVQPLIGSAPITPSWLPAGFELAVAAVQPQPPVGQASTAGGANPPNSNVVSLTYRRGVERITITTRRTDLAARWFDPFGTATTGTNRRSPVRLRGGRFLGTTVEQLTGLPSVPHLWGRTDDVVFTVAGDVDPGAMVRIAESLT